MKIAVIVGGTNEPSNSNILADTFIEGIKTIPGMEVVKLRLKDLNLQHFELKHYDHGICREDDFCKIADAIEGTAGIVYATPIWNFSVPAHFKNFIDRLGAIGLDTETHSKGQWKGKPVFLIYTGGAPMIAWKALMYLTTLHVTESVKYYGGTVVGKHFEPRSLPGKGTFGVVVDQRPKTLERLHNRGAWFAKIAKRFEEHGRLPFFFQMRFAFFTFAYRVGNRIMYPISNLQ